MELAGSAWMLVSFETEMSAIPAVAKASSTLTFTAEGEQARRQRRMQPLLRELHFNGRSPLQQSDKLHTYDVQPHPDGAGGPFLSGALSRRAL